MKRLVLVLAIIILCVPLLSVKQPAFANTNSAEVVMESKSRRVLHSHNSQLRMEMASTTKIVTAIIIIESCNLEEVIEIPKQAVGVEGSSLYLIEGEKLTVKELLYGLMLRSGNDAAVALALHHSGNIENFANCMNEFAQRIGCTNSNFKNPHGLSAENHYTTAYDLAYITCYAMNNSTFKDIVSTKSVKISNGNGGYRYLINKNKMLFNYEGANGVKTGYTTRAGRCLVSSAEKEQNATHECNFEPYGKIEIVCVVLNTPEMFERSCELITTATQDYTNYLLSKNGQIYKDCGVELEAHSNCVFPLTKAETSRISYEFEQNSLSRFKSKKNDKWGKLKIYLEKQLLFNQNLYYNS